MLETTLQSGADLFLWIVCIFIAFIAAISFIDFKNTHGPSDPHTSPEDHGHEAYWKSRKHAEDVHKEFPQENVRASKDPVRTTARPKDENK